MHVRIQRGGGSGTPPPPEICQRWGLVWMFGRKERGPKVVLAYYHYFLARFARSPAAYISKNLKNILINSMLKGHGMVIPYLNTSYIFNL